MQDEMFPTPSESSDAPAAADEPEAEEAPGQPRPDREQAPGGSSPEADAGAEAEAGPRDAADEPGAEPAEAPDERGAEASPAEMGGEPSPVGAAAEERSPAGAAAGVPADEEAQPIPVLEDESAEEAEAEPVRPVRASVEGNGAGELAAAGEEAEEEEEEPLDDRFLPGDWYVVHTYAGYENKVKANLRSRIQSMNMEDKIFDVVIPTEEVMELKSGRRQVVQRKVFPGYILVRMLLDDDSWYVVRNTPGVTGFVGAGAKPTPLSLGEVGKILAPKEGERPRPRVEYEEGEVVRVVSGPFSNMSGPVAEINVDQQTVKVLVDIFGRETPVTLAFDQVAKL